MALAGRNTPSVSGDGFSLSAAASAETGVRNAWDEKKAGEEVERFRRFLDDGRDELVALQILYRLPHAQRRLTDQALDDLGEAMRRPPRLLQPPDIRRAYRRLSADKVRGNPADIAVEIRSAHSTI